MMAFQGVSQMDSERRAFSRRQFLTRNAWAVGLALAACSAPQGVYEDETGAGCSAASTSWVGGSAGGGGCERPSRLARLAW